MSTKTSMARRSTYYRGNVNVVPRETLQNQLLWGQWWKSEGENNGFQG